MNLRDLAAEFGVSVSILRRFMPDLFPAEMAGSSSLTDETVSVARNAWAGRRTIEPDFTIIFLDSAPERPEQSERDRVVAYCEEPIRRAMHELVGVNYRGIPERIMQLVRNGLEMCFDAGQVHERSTVSPPMMSMIEALIGTAVGLKTAELTERIEALETAHDWVDKPNETPTDKS